MSSRRPLLRSFSGSGTSGSFNGDVLAAPSSRADGRGYPFSGMRTETRSTLCSVMAHLAVETQPSFETTLKSKAVSESCNAKFTCVVSGNPAPEVTWYKDDMELDRYCGLPKYEIFRNGKTHTLQIYNCTQEDAAIYQASARNSKGIVSCSGLLEVGAMNEFMIHQRFFAKLKQKADSKRKELEQSRRRGDRESAHAAAVAEQPRVVAPARRTRLIRSPSEPGPTPPEPPLVTPETKPVAPETKPVAPETKPFAPETKPVALETKPVALETKPVALETKPVALETKPVAPETKPVALETKPVERPVLQLAERPAMTAKTPAAKENGKPAFLYFGNKVQIISTRPAAKDTVANKAIKTNRADSIEPAGGSAGDGGSGPSGSGKEKAAGEEDEVSLARYLTRCSEPEPPGPQRHDAPQDDVLKPEPVGQAAREKETAKNKGAPVRGPLEVSVPAVRVPPETTGLKGHESPSTLASMFLSLRDMFFRNKSKNGDPAVNSIDPVNVSSVKVEGRGTPTASPVLPRSEPPQTRRREASGRTQTPAPQPEPTMVDRAPPSADVCGNGPPLPKMAPAPPGCHMPERRLGSEGPAAGVTVSTVPSLPAGAGEDSRAAPPPPPRLHGRVELPPSDWSRSPEAAPTLQSPPENKVTVDCSQKNEKDMPSGRDLSTCPHKQEIQLHASADDTSVLHNRILSASEAPSQNTQLHASGFEESPEIVPGASGLNHAARSEDASESPAVPGVVSVGAGEMPAGNLRSWDNNAPFVQGPGERRTASEFLDKETRMHGGKGVTETTASDEKKAEEFLMNVSLDKEIHSGKGVTETTASDEKKAEEFLMNVSPDKEMHGGKGVTETTASDEKKAEEFLMNVSPDKEMHGGKGVTETTASDEKKAEEFLMNVSPDKEMHSGKGVTETTASDEKKAEEFLMKVSQDKEMHCGKGVTETTASDEKKAKEFLMNVSLDKEMHGGKGVTETTASDEKKAKEFLMNVSLDKEMHGGKGVTETTASDEKKAEAEQKEIPTELPMVVQEKLEGTQPDKVLQNVTEGVRNVQKDGDANSIHTPETKPEVIILQLRLPVVPEVLDRSCAKTSFLKSQVKNIIEPPTPFADNTSTIPEQSNLLKDAMGENPPLHMAESTGKTTPVTPIQQITVSNKDLSQPKEIPKPAQQDREIKPGREMANVNSCGQPCTTMSSDSPSVTRNSKKDNSGYNKTDVDDQHNSVMSSFTIWPVLEVSTLVVPTISVTCSDDISPENDQPFQDEVKELDSVAMTMQEVMRDLDSCVTLFAAGKKEIHSTPCCVEEATPTDDSRTPSGITTPERSVKETPLNVSESPQEKVLLCADVIDTHPNKQQQQKQPQFSSDTLTDQHVKDTTGIHESNPINPESPLLSPATSRRDLVADTPNMEASGLLAVPAIRVDSTSSVEKDSGEETVVDAFPSPAPSCETSPRLRKRNNLTPIPSATPEELALGARRKILISRSKTEDAEVLSSSTDAPAQKERAPSREQEAPYASPGQSRRPSLLQLPAGQQTPPLPRRSPNLGRKRTTLVVPKCPEETVKEADTIKPEPKSAEKDKLDPLKAPQVIRKIRAEPFSDNGAHIKLCCQFFNVLSDSTIKWCRDEAEIVEVTRSARDESPVALAIVHVSSMDCGVYSCSIKNEYGTDSTDFFLSATSLSGFLLRADLEVGQEIEMTPMLFAKGLADPGRWGNKFFGRIMIAESHVGDGRARKASRARVIYGLEPAFESGSTCVLKVRNPIGYGKKDENNLVERNLEITQQECKVQNTIREYCKVFSAEARVAGNFGSVLEVIPLYLMYQPANAIPYATAEADLKGAFLKHCLTDPAGRLIVRTGSEVERMCCTFQHWIHQWTNGNLLLTRLEGVDGKITNVGVATKLKGYQGLSDKATPEVFEQFAAQHQCNGYCSLLGLQPLKAADSLTQPTRTKGSRSPMPNRKGSASPQTMRKWGTTSPQTPRKVSSSPRLTRRSSESGNGKPVAKNNSVEATKVVGTS